MALCKHADLRAIELYQPLGHKHEDSNDFPFHCEGDPAGTTLTCFGDTWCTRCEDDICPKHHEEKKEALFKQHSLK